MTGYIQLFCSLDRKRRYELFCLSIVDSLSSASRNKRIEISTLKMAHGETSTRECKNEMAAANVRCAHIQFRLADYIYYSFSYEKCINSPKNRQLNCAAVGLYSINDIIIQEVINHTQFH